MIVTNVRQFFVIKTLQPAEDLRKHDKLRTIKAYSED